MACRPPRLCLAASLGLGALSAAGQPAPASAPADPHTPPALARTVVTPATVALAPPAADRPRPISSDIAAALATVMPAYNPPAAAPTSAETNAVTAGPATPKNGILRLPEYVVHDQKVRPFTERELYTPAALQEIAVKRYITEFDAALNAFSIPLLSGWSLSENRGNSPGKRAMRKYDEDEDRQRSAEINDLWALEATH